MKTLTNWIIAAVAAILLGLVPMIGHAATVDSEGFCSVVADAAQVATSARNQGELLGQYRSEIARLAHNDAKMALLLDKMGVIVFTSEDFAGLTPEQAVRYAYRSCMSAR